LRRFDQRRRQGIEVGAVDRADAASFFLSDEFRQTAGRKSIS
jgi:hypothetical protein